MKMSQSKQNSSSQQLAYIFQTQTRKLKHYYSDHPTQLLNHRIIFNNSSGTVRYIGPLKHQGKPKGSQKQLWVGLEWDDVGRGKHNGNVNGCKYFACQNNCGSLVKFQKIQFGYKLQTALFKRYFRAQELHLAKDTFESLKILKKEAKQKNKQLTQQLKKNTDGKRIRNIQLDSQAYINTLKQSKKIMVQFVGFDQIWAKINNLQKLQSISLPKCRICDFGPQGHLSNILSNLKILSIQNNLISDWNQIFQLGLELRKLEQLSLSNNKITPYNKNMEEIHSIQIPQQQCKYEIKSPKQIFPCLKCIILINTGLTWKSLFQISPTFQSTIEQLIICKNNLTDFQNVNEQQLNKFISLTFINFQMINITQFNGINKFKNLPKLSKLTLNQNKIKQLGKIEGFNHLKYLSLQHCQIDNPKVLNQISQFKQLQSLNIKHNPVGQRLGNAYVRMRAVAQIQKLHVINGVQINKFDRKDCQIFYLRETFHQYFHLKKVPDYDYDYKDFLSYCNINHPNIQKFIKKYGNPYEVQVKKQIKQIIKDEVSQNEVKKGTGLVQIIIKNKYTQSQQKKKVPLSWTISNLRNYFAKVHKIPVNIQKLQIQINNNSQFQQLTEDHKNLGFYHVTTGSAIIVSRKD